MNRNDELSPEAKALRKEIALVVSEFVYNYAARPVNDEKMRACFVFVHAYYLGAINFMP